MDQELKQLPISVTSFEKMIKGNYIYVDKTRFLAQIINQQGPHFLSRPRRFGKSTLIDTFDQLFSGKQELFKNTYIGKNHACPKQSYKILRFSFTSVKSFEGIAFHDVFKSEIIRILKKSGLTISSTENLTASQLFRDYLDSQALSSLVLLIDEYDAPLTEVLDNKEEFELRKSSLSAFYLAVKDYADKFKFIFITGVTKYSHLSIFSAFNNLNDLSLNPDFGSIVGYTQTDLETYFKRYVEKAVCALNEKYGANTYTYDNVLANLKLNYDGYSFDEECKDHVYNPWSILNFLNSPKRGFRPYWSETGGAATPTLLIKYLNKIDLDSNLPNFEEFLDLDRTKGILLSELIPSIESIESEDLGLLPILYQAGYFCIKSPAIGNSTISIGIPNLEVKQAFAEIVVKSLSLRISDQNRHNYAKDTALNLLNEFKDKKIECIKNRLNKYINSISYKAISKFNEAAYRDFFVTLIMFCGASNIQKENITAQGQSDLIFEYADKIYICEFKIAKNQNQAQKLVQKAKAQIKDRKYDVLPTNKEAVNYAIVILHQNKTETAACKYEILSVETD